MAKYARFLPIIALIVAEILWGANKPVIKLGLQTVVLPLYLSVTILGAALLILPLALTDWKRLSLRDYALLISGSVVSITAGNGALLMSLQRIPAGNAALIGLFEPLILFVLSAQFLRERLSLRTFIGILVAFIGGAIIVGKPWEAVGGNNTAVIGGLFMILSVVADIIGTLICKSVLKKGGTYQVTFIHLFSGILPLVFFSLQYIGGLSYASAAESGYVTMAINIVAITFANCLFMYGLKRRKMQDVSVFLYISPLATIIAAWLILHEVPSVATVLGAAFIFTGVYLTTVKKPKKSVRV